MEVGLQRTVRTGVDKNFEIVIKQRVASSGPATLGRLKVSYPERNEGDRGIQGHPTLNEPSASRTSKLVKPSAYPQFFLRLSTR